MLEKEIEKRILHFLQDLGILAWKNQRIGVYDKRKNVFRRSNNPFLLVGVSDIFCVYNGRFIAIEVKSKTGRPSESQLNFIKRVQEAGGIAFITRSVEQTWSQLSHFIDNSDRFLHIVNRHLKVEASH